MVHMNGTLSVHESRGLEAIKACGLLPMYSGRVMHDSLVMYFNDMFRFQHALCGAHLLRECQGIVDNDGHEWAAAMKELLKEAWKLAKTARSHEQALEPQMLAELEMRYDDILIFESLVLAQRGEFSF